MAVLSTLLHATTFSRPFLSTLVPSIALAYTLQAAVAVPSIIAQTERFYDLSGSLTYLSCTALALYLPTIRARHAAAAVGAIKPAWPSILGALRGVSGAGLNWRQVVLSAAVSIWATRCGFSQILHSSTHDPAPAFMSPSLHEISSEKMGLITSFSQKPQWEPTSSSASPPTVPTPASTTFDNPHRNSSAPSSRKPPGYPSA